MALSPPKASSEGLLARHAPKRDTAASTLIQAIVIACTLRIRRKVSSEATWSADAIQQHYGTVRQHRGSKSHQVTTDKSSPGLTR
jgi:hypothetical protein